MGLFDPKNWPRVDDEYGRAIGQVVRDALWPYHPGAVTMFTDFDLDYNQYRLIVESTRFWSEPFVTRLDRDDILDDPEAIMSEVCQKAFDHYRNLSRVDPEDHISLGDN